MGAISDFIKHNGGDIIEAYDNSVKFRVGKSVKEGTITLLAKARRCNLVLPCGAELYNIAEHDLTKGMLEFLYLPNHLHKLSWSVPIELISKATASVDCVTLSFVSIGRVLIDCGEPGRIGHYFVHREAPTGTGGIKFDEGKVRAGLVLRGFDLALMEVAKVGTFGAQKYAPDNWKKVEPSRYEDALFRHLLAHEQCDPETKLLHLAHAAWNILALLQHQLTPQIVQLGVQPLVGPSILPAGHPVQADRVKI